MKFELYRGYILGPGEKQGYMDAPEINIYRELRTAKNYTPWHVSENDYEAELWIDRQPEGSGRAVQADVDDLNGEGQFDKDPPVPKYPIYIMQMVRQHLNLESYDTSRDSEINAMTHNEIFDHCLEWEGIIGYGGTLHSWVFDIFGVTLE